MNRQDRTSLLLHQAVAERLRDDPALLAIARRNVARWRSFGSDSPQQLWAGRWGERLEWSLERLIGFLLREDDEAQQYRSCSPFAGVLTQAQRRKILEAVSRQDEAAAA